MPLIGFGEFLRGGAPSVTPAPPVVSVTPGAPAPAAAAPTRIPFGEFLRGGPRPSTSAPMVQQPAPPATAAQPAALANTPPAVPAVPAVPAPAAAPPPQATQPTSPPPAPPSGPSGLQIGLGNVGLATSLASGVLNQVAPSFATPPAPLPGILPAETLVTPLAGPPADAGLPFDDGSRPGTTLASGGQAVQTASGALGAISGLANAATAAMNDQRTDAQRVLGATGGVIQAAAGAARIPEVAATLPSVAGALGASIQTPIGAIPYLSLVGAGLNIISAALDPHSSDEQIAGTALSTVTNLATSIGATTAISSGMASAGVAGVAGVGLAIGAAGGLFGAVAGMAVQAALSQIFDWGGNQSRAHRTADALGQAYSEVGLGSEGFGPAGPLGVLGAENYDELWAQLLRQAPGVAQTVATGISFTGAGPRLDVGRDADREAFFQAARTRPNDLRAITYSGAGEINPLQAPLQQALPAQLRLLDAARDALPALNAGIADPAHRYQLEDVVYGLIRARNERTPITAANISPYLAESRAIRRIRTQSGSPLNFSPLSANLDLPLTLFGEDPGEDPLTGSGSTDPGAVPDPWARWARSGVLTEDQPSRIWIDAEGTSAVVPAIRGTRPQLDEVRAQLAAVGASPAVTNQAIAYYQQRRRAEIDRFLVERRSLEGFQVSNDPGGGM